LEKGSLLANVVNIHVRVGGRRNLTGRIS
jgi:hypothetical protein